MAGKRWCRWLLGPRDKSCVMMAFWMMIPHSGPEVCVLDYNEDIQLCALFLVTWNLAFHGVFHTYDPALLREKKKN
jgi:hypothetical protein